MVIYLPGQALDEAPLLDELTPREIVQELDKYVIGQADAKRAVAIALRNRIRRQKLEPELAEEVMPKNILMIGPTGVGKTEIARRLAKLANSPFLKVEASKFTEVGYVGRDVEAIIRDLVDIAIDMVREERLEEVAERAEKNAEERLLDLLMPPQPEASESADRTREKLREKLRAGKLDDRMVEIDVRDRGPTFEISTNTGLEEMDVNLKDVLPGLFGQRTRKRKMRVAEAAEYLVQEEEQKLIDMDQVTRVALDRVERNGIVFLDEIDKIAGREGGHGPDVSREGVQRDILPIVEGTTVNTRHGFVRTDHILFVAAGAFHVSKPSDLIPELQGRFPIRVELKSLSEADFIRILREPKGALVKQYIALLDTEGIKLTFTDDAIEQIAAFAAQRQPNVRKHRRAALAHHHGEAAGRDLVRRARSQKEERADRRGLCPQATGGHRERSGSEPVHPLADARVGNHPLRHWIAVAGRMRLHRRAALSGVAHSHARTRPAGGGARRPTRHRLHHSIDDHRRPAAERNWRRGSARWPRAKQRLERGRMGRQRHQHQGAHARCPGPSTGHDSGDCVFWPGCYRGGARLKSQRERCRMVRL